jgi:hypothetical protein
LLRRSFGHSCRFGTSASLGSSQSFSLFGCCPLFCSGHHPRRLFCPPFSLQLLSISANFLLITLWGWFYSTPMGSVQIDVPQGVTFVFVINDVFVLVVKVAGYLWKV